MVSNLRSLRRFLGVYDCFNNVDTSQKQLLYSKLFCHDLLNGLRLLIIYFDGLISYEVNPSTVLIALNW